MGGLPWIKFYTDLLTHPKAVGLSDAAWRALTLAWLYSAKHETDGRVPLSARRTIRLTATAERALTEGNWMRLDFGNGETNGVTGWVINDWEDHQETVEKAAARRRATAERVARHRAGRSVKATSGNAVSNATKSKREKDQRLSPPLSPPRVESAAPAAPALAEPKPPAPDVDYTPPSDEEIDAALSPELQAARRRGRVSGKAEQTRREQRAQMDAAAHNGEPITEDAARASVEFLRRKIEMEATDDS